MTARSIVVVVRDRAGNPVAGARAWISRAPVAIADLAALTDDAGRAVLSAPSAGRYSVTAATDDATATSDVDVGTVPAVVAVVL